MNCMETTMEEIVLAAWFHDVGKFAQRADVSELYNKELEGEYGVIVKDGKYINQHVVYTAGFVNEYKSIFPSTVNTECIKALASNYCNPTSQYDLIITEADKLSSGVDEGCVVFDNKTAYNPMLHILSTIQLEEKSNPKKAYCKIAPLDEDNVLSLGDYKVSKTEYRILWDSFVKDFKKLEGLAFNDFLLALNTLFERYLWCIPASSHSEDDISLYQHTKISAALAGTLFQYHQEKETVNEEAVKNSDEDKFLFINGDISGIQKYIFDLKSTKDNAKLLRAKSFQLWALGEILAQYIVKQFDVTYANILTSAGGKFIVLVPNTEKARNLLPQIQLEIEEYFLQEFSGKLAVIISEGKAASAKDLQQGNVQKLINQIGDEADKAKSKKMQKVLQKCGAVLTEQYVKLQQNGECPKCGIFAASRPEGEDNERECASCKQLTDIGRQLVKSAKVVLKSDKLGHFAQMIKLYDWDQDCPFAYSINDYKPGKPLMYLPYVAPKDNNDDLLTFEEIANLSQGNKKLAMFKADIDNLGLVFSQSLGKRMSFSRYADLSHMLHYFFSSFYAWFVNTRADQNGRLYKERIYTVFSGGDDLCILGSWDTVMQFALDFRKALNEFTHNNPSVTISGGISVVNSKVPVRNIADEAEELLENSKALDGKNAITVFGTTVSWDNYEKCLVDGKFLQEQLELNRKNGKQGVSSGVVYKFLDFANRAEKTLGKNGVADVRELVSENMKDRIWKSNMIYVVTRNVEQAEVRKRLLDFGTNPESMINSRIAVSYALYTQRNS